MTTYERAKAYEHVSQKVKDFFEGKQKMYSDVKQTLEYLFPELVESEDIRERLINTIKSSAQFDYCLRKAGFKVKEVIAWLEKQGEAFTKRDVDDAYLKGICDAKRELEKQGEQKPAWSKEDITNYSKVLFCLQTLTFPNDDERKELITWLKKQCEQNSADSYCQENCKGFQETGKCFADGECKAKREAGQNIEEEFDDFFNLESVIDIVEMYGKGEVDLYGSNVTSELKWLKSLRDRVYWKPTEEQMNCFKQAIDLFKTKVNDDLVLRILNSLYNDLKKL